MKTPLPSAEFQNKSVSPVVRHRRYEIDRTLLLFWNQGHSSVFRRSLAEPLIVRDRGQRSPVWTGRHLAGTSPAAMRLRVAGAVLLSAAAYYVYLPLPSGVSEPWKLMLLDALFRSFLQAVRAEGCAGRAGWCDGSEQSVRGSQNTAPVYMSSYIIISNRTDQRQRESNDMMHHRTRCEEQHDVRCLKSLIITKIQNINQYVPCAIM